MTVLVMVVMLMMMMMMMEMEMINRIDEIGMGGENAGCEGQEKNWKMVEGSVVTAGKHEGRHDTTAARGFGGGMYDCYKDLER